MPAQPDHRPTRPDTHLPPGVVREASRISGHDAVTRSTGDDTAFRSTKDPVRVGAEWDRDLVPQDLLYHYTTAAGLNGILTSGSIYATDAEFLNDAQELRYGRPELCAALMAELGLSPGMVLGQLDGPAGRSGRIAVALSYLADDSVERSAAFEPVFVTCFCQDGDLLSQWRGYGGPGGYAIGFDTAVLARLVDADSSCVGVQPVQYGPAAVEAMVQRVIDSFRPDPPISRSGSTLSIEGWRHTNGFVLAQLATIKHPAFGEEAEWRIIARAAPSEQQIRFREGTLGLIPYRSIDLGAAIREIVVGPGTDQRTRELGVRRLLQAHDASDNVRVRTSSASYRG